MRPCNYKRSTSNLHHRWPCNTPWRWYQPIAPPTRRATMFHGWCWWNWSWRWAALVKDLFIFEITFKKGPLNKCRRPSINSVASNTAIESHGSLLKTPRTGDGTYWKGRFEDEIRVQCRYPRRCIPLCGNPWVPTPCQWSLLEILSRWWTSSCSHSVSQLLHDRYVSLRPVLRPLLVRHNTQHMILCTLLLNKPV